MKITYLLLLSLFCSVSFIFSCKSKKEDSKSANSSNTDISNRNFNTSLTGLYKCFKYVGDSIDQVNKDKVFEQYNINFIKIKGDSAYYDIVPIFVYNNDTTYSPINGKFYYSGTWERNDTAVIFHFVELFCSNCDLPVKTESGEIVEYSKITLDMICALREDGFFVNGSLTTRLPMNKVLISEHSEYSQDIK